MAGAGIDNFSITKRMLIKRDVTSGVHYCSLLEYFAIAVTTYTAGILRWRDTKINDIHDFTGYCYFHDKTELGGCFLHSVLLALSLGPD